MDAAAIEKLDAVRLTPEDMASLERLGADAQDLFDRTMDAKAKMERRGKHMGSVKAYMLSVARRDFGERNGEGVTLDVIEELATGNVFQQQAARKSIAQACAHDPGTPVLDPTRKLRAALMRDANDLLRARDPRYATNRCTSFEARGCSSAKQSELTIRRRATTARK
jgi:hypothetical protein